MKKAITIILIVAILVIATIGFCGCDDKKSTIDNDRFVVIQHNDLTTSVFGKDEYTIVLYDKETKVMYLFVKNGYGGGLTVLVNADGTPMLYEEGEE